MLINKRFPRQKERSRKVFSTKDKQQKKSIIRQSLEGILISLFGLGALIILYTLLVNFDWILITNESFKELVVGLYQFIIAFVNLLFVMTLLAFAVLSTFILFGGLWRLVKVISLICKKINKRYQYSGSRRFR